MEAWRGTVCSLGVGPQRRREARPAQPDSAHARAQGQPTLRPRRGQSFWLHALAAVCLDRCPLGRLCFCRAACPPHGGMSCVEPMDLGRRAMLLWAAGGPRGGSALAAGPGLPSLAQRADVAGRAQGLAPVTAPLLGVRAEHAGLGQSGHAALISERSPPTGSFVNSAVLLGAPSV